jgi:hypothetical protein
MTEIPGNGTFNYAPTGILMYTGNIMSELTNKLLVVGSGGGAIFRGLISCNLGNAPFYDTIISKTILIDITSRTTLMQGSDGYIYILNLNGLLQRLVYDPTYVNNETVTSGFCLLQNYPNPFNPSTNISFIIPASKGEKGITSVSLKIYDVRGCEVTFLVNEQMKAGNYSVAWDASDFPSGVYFYKLTAGDFTSEKKMVLVK